MRCLQHSPVSGSWQWTETAKTEFYLVEQVRRPFGSKRVPLSPLSFRPVMRPVLTELPCRFFSVGLHRFCPDNVWRLEMRGNALTLSISSEQLCALHAELLLS